MKNKILLSLFLLTASINSFGTTWTINNSGTTFTPGSITISLGDSVFFDIESMHDAVEVSLATWNANGNTMLAGGFSTPFGGGWVLPSSLSAGTHYFVCEPHASMGMKGSIIVVNSTGIDEMLSKISISIFPNPSTELIKITSGSELTNTAYTITDISGRLMQEGVLSHDSQTIDISMFPEGVYLFLLNDSRRKAIRIIKN